MMRIVEVVDSKTLQSVALSADEIESMRHASDGTTVITMKSGREVSAAQKPVGSGFAPIAQSWDQALVDATSPHWRWGIVVLAIFVLVELSR